jgi:hypothetical protein
MNLEIVEIVGCGDLDEERVVIRSLCNHNVGNNFIFSTKKHQNGGVCADIVYAYWFRNRDIKQNDILEVYTKEGIDYDYQNPDGTTTYVIYRDIDKPIFTTNLNTAVVMEQGQWKTKSVDFV